MMVDFALLGEPVLGPDEDALKDWVEDAVMGYLLWGSISNYVINMTGGMGGLLGKIGNHRANRRECDWPRGCAGRSRWWRRCQKRPGTRWRSATGRRSRNRVRARPRGLRRLRGVAEPRVESAGCGTMF